MTIQDVYEKWEHLDHLLSDREWLGDEINWVILFDLWQAIKEHMEKDNDNKIIAETMAMSDEELIQELESAGINTDKLIEKVRGIVKLHSDENWLKLIVGLIRK